MNYSCKKFIKQSGPSIVKGVTLIGIASIMCVCLSSAKNAAGNEAQPVFNEAATVVMASPTPAPTPEPTPEPDPTIACGSFINPAAGTISSSFGSRWGRHHDGVDIAGDTDSDILAADAGKVVYADWMSGYGNYIIIDHENGMKTAYGHCNSLLVNAGDRVVQGEVIAKMGSTGNSTGPHLHFEVKINDEVQDPLGYVVY